MPLRGEGHEHLDYLLAAEAIRAGTLKITEVSQTGSVPELLAVSTADAKILLLDGEELVGAKQNRILNTTILVPPKSKTVVPVSCVEQGRWKYRSDHFVSGDCAASPKLRARKSRDVGENLRRTGRADSNQGALWQEVAYCMADARTVSPTMAMHDVIENRKTSIDGYVEALKYPGAARGIVAAIGGRFVALDLFDNPRTLESLWSRLITGYVLDAVGMPPTTNKPFTGKGASTLLEHIGDIECHPLPSVGMGQDWRFEADDVVGQALIVEEVCVHLSAFPNERADRRNDRDGYIMSPSRRRRHTPSPENID